MQIISYLQVSEQLYALITKSLIQTYSSLKALGAISTQDLNQDSNIILSPTAKGLSLFTVFLFLIKKNKIKKEEKASTKLGNTWNKGKGKHFRKRVNILLHFESDC